MAKLPKNTGTENPAKAEKVEISIKNSQTRPTAASAGSFSRKIPSDCPVFAGQYVAGEANQVKITTGRSSPGKKTWMGAAEGYTNRSFPDYQPSPAADTYQDTEPFKTGSKPAGLGYLAGRLDSNNIKKDGVGPEQRVKDHGRNSTKHGGEAKQVAGQRSATTRS